MQTETQLAEAVAPASETAPARPRVIVVRPDGMLEAIAPPRRVPMTVRNPASEREATAEFDLD